LENKTSNLLPPPPSNRGNNNTKKERGNINGTYGNKVKEMQKHKKNKGRKGTDIRRRRKYHFWRGVIWFGIINITNRWWKKKSDTMKQHN
jgi:hypothetical protein